MRVGMDIGVRMFGARLKHAQPKVLWTRLSFSFWLWRIEGTCHFDVPTFVFFIDVLDIYTRWVILDALGKGVVLCFETGEEVLDASKHCP